MAIIAGLFSFYQIFKSSIILNSYKNLGESKYAVRRNNSLNDILVSAEDLVVGDVIKIKAGDKIPADIRIIESQNMKVDNSHLTGESDTIEITGRCGDEGFKDPKDAKNVVFFSTICTFGEGHGIVIRIGTETYMGSIADLVYTADGNKAPLHKEIVQFVKIIATIAIICGIMFLSIGLVMDSPVIKVFIFAIGIIVANVPEGLVASFTLCLFIMARKLQNKKMLIKKLESVETFGSITCVCFDKTGTITQGKMKVVHLWYDGEVKYSSNKQTKIQSQNQDISSELPLIDWEDPSFEKLKFAAVCSSDGTFSSDVPDDYPPYVVEFTKWKIKNKYAKPEEVEAVKYKLKEKFKNEYLEGDYKKNIDGRKMHKTDETEQAILKFFEKYQNITIVREKYPIISNNAKIPFNSSIKFSAYVRKVFQDIERVNYKLRVAVKGAPEKVLELCEKFLMKGKEYKMTSEIKNRILIANEDFAMLGERVLALAYIDVNPNQYPPETNFYSSIQSVYERGMKVNKLDSNIPRDKLVFAGLVAIEDPPRESVKKTLEICKEAGIKAIMVTGDQVLTAASIAHQVGIIENMNNVPYVIMKNNKYKTIEEAERRTNVLLFYIDYSNRWRYINKEDPRR